MQAIQTPKGKAYIQVKDTSDPYKNVKNSSDPDQNKPDQFSFDKTSPYANQTYATAAGTASETDASYQKGLQATFITKSYFQNGAQAADTSIPGAQSQVPVNSADGYLTKAAGYDKSFLTGAATEQNKTVDFANESSSYQGRTALLGGHDIKTFASNLSDKTYEGPEANSVKRDVAELDHGLLSLKELPNRPLTIDEVRALINHGVKPDLNQKPDEASKPLNDPAYTPDAAPANLPDLPRGHLRDENDTDPIPSPGSIAHPPEPSPEASEPLPH